MSIKSNIKLLNFLIISLLSNKKYNLIIIVIFFKYICGYTGNISNNLNFKYSYKRLNTLSKDINNNKYNCVYNINDPLCERCIPYTHFKSSAMCYNCSNHIQFCKYCSYDKGCEECYNTHKLYSTSIDLYISCIEKRVKCSSTKKILTRFNEKIEICYEDIEDLNNDDSSISYENNYLIILVIVIVGSLLTTIVIICFITCILKKYFNKNTKKRKNKAVYNLNHNKCSICGKCKNELLKSNVSLNEENKLNCDGILCNLCIDIAKENCLKGEYVNCVECKKLVIWFVSKDKEEISINDNVCNNKNIIESSNVNNIYINQLNSNTIALKNSDLIKKEINNNCIDISKNNNTAVNNINNSNLTSKRKSILSNNKTTNVDKEIVYNCNINKYSNNHMSLDDNDNNCVVCFKKNPNAVIPCKYKPLHKLHDKCLADFYHSYYNKCKNNAKLFLCPICRSDLIV